MIISHDKNREQRRNLLSCEERLKMIIADCSREEKVKEVALKKETPEMKESRIKSKKMRSERQTRCKWD